MANVTISLGTGWLGWNRDERITDRYGSVALSTEGDPKLRTGSIADLMQKDSTEKRIPFKDIPLGKKGKLWARVISTRDQFHIGDLARGIGCSKPDVGEMILLGEGGTLFLDDAKECVGLKPGDGRESDWLDPVKLYRAFDQQVELLFEEA